MEMAVTDIDNLKGVDSWSNESKYQKLIKEIAELKDGDPGNEEIDKSLFNDVLDNELKDELLNLDYKQINDLIKMIDINALDDQNMIESVEKLQSCLEGVLREKVWPMIWGCFSIDGDGSLQCNSNDVWDIVEDLIGKNSGVKSKYLPSITIGDKKYQNKYDFYEADFKDDESGQWFILYNNRIYVWEFWTRDDPDWLGNGAWCMIYNNWDTYNWNFKNWALNGSWKIDNSNYTCDWMFKGWVLKGETTFVYKKNWNKFIGTYDSYGLDVTKGAKFYNKAKNEECNLKRDNNKKMRKISDGSDMGKYISDEDCSILGW